jgi:hypothetical protein
MTLGIQHTFKLDGHIMIGNLNARYRMDNCPAIQLALQREQVSIVKFERRAQFLCTTKVLSL